MTLTGSAVSDLFGKRAELDEQSIHDRIVELESRITWISSELGDPKNQSPTTCRYSKETLESFEEEKNILELYANVLYRRGRIIEK
jgi:hypothetical protein